MLERDDRRPGLRPDPGPDFLPGAETGRADGRRRPVLNLRRKTGDVPIWVARRPRPPLAMGEPLAMMARISIALGVVLAAPLVARADGPAPTFASVADLQNAHDRALIRDLIAHIRDHPKAEDVDQAYMTLFDKLIEHDWFAEHEAVAARYLADHPDGAVRSLAQIVATMARAQAGRFAEALARYNELMRTLGKPEQEEFAANFADTLANASTTAGEYEVARQVYRTLLDRFGESPNLRQKVKDDLNRLDLVGKPAPRVVAKDVTGETFRLEDLRGKYVLVDFWAT
ncbi:MAG: redoxin domain-containing protein, partial [Planctomycetaceae bacterium]|nr:redoxin domain-containing protein [Planctomycetaceae bacterium]